MEANYVGEKKKAATDKTRQRMVHN